MRSLDLYELINRRQRRRQRKDSSAGKRLGRGFGAFAVVLSIAAVVGLIVLSVSYANLTQGLPSLEHLTVLLDLDNGLLLQPTRLYERNGQKLLTTLENPGVQRRFLSISPDAAEYFSPQLLQATVAVLDPTFWQNPGFTKVSIGNDEPLTLAERLVEDLLLWQEPDGTRKALHMRLLAAQLVARYGRAQVLEWYLNSAYYGHMAYGADSAAMLYLDKPASQLNLAEVALLVAVNETPALNPLDAPAAARERQQEELQLLLDRGVINQEEYQEASKTELQFREELESDYPLQAQAFTRLVLEHLSKTYDRRRIEMGGLRIVTTLDQDLQEQLSCVARSQLLRLEGQPASITLPGSDQVCEAARLLPTMPPSDVRLPADTLVSGVILDPQNGEVLALLGESTAIKESSVFSAHASGSLLTPFASVAAFARGRSPASLVWDIPDSMPQEVAQRRNPDGEFHGPVNMRTAMANDYLVPFAQLVDQMGAREVWKLAAPFGIPDMTLEEEPVDVFFDGGYMTPLEIAHAYAVFANTGLQHGRMDEHSGELQPVLVKSVEELDGRRWLSETLPDVQSVVSAPLAYLVHDVLSDQLARRESLGHPNPLEIGRVVGAKVGQTADKDQVWTVGYTPQRVAVVWISLPEVQDEEILLDVRMPAGLWHALMQYTVRNLPVTDWEMPPGLNVMSVCRPSGDLPTAACPDVVTEVFIQGNEPTVYDTLYKSFQVNRETGKLATVFTPLEVIEEQTFMVLPLNVQDWATQAGIPQPPTTYDVIQPPPVSADVQITSPQNFGYVTGKVPVMGTAAGKGFVSYRVQVGAGLNPQTWQQVGTESSVPLAEGSLAYWDTEGLEGLYAVRLLVQREEQEIDQMVIQVTVDNTPPLVQIPYPLQDQVFSYLDDRQITLQADVEDAVGVEKVVWLIDGEVVGERSQAPYTVPWELKVGEHTLTAQTTDYAGNEAESTTVHFSVNYR